MNKSIVDKNTWLKARLELLEKEKEFTRIRDELTKQRQSLPWLRIEKEYVFESEEGPVTLADLFGDKSQLIVYHYMLGPGVTVGCKSCSFWTDQYEPIVVHLHQRDANLVAISRSEVQNIEAFKHRMGWRHQWVSSLGNDFNFDFKVTLHSGADSEYNYKMAMTSGESEMPGISVFYKDEAGNIYHTYSTYARGLEDLNTVYRYLDILPKGRDEDDLPYGMAWVKLRDEY